MEAPAGVPRQTAAGAGGEVDFLDGKRLSFDEESRALFDAVAPSNSEAHFDSVLAQLDTMLPGRGPVAARYEAYHRKFAIPRDRLTPVFDAAIEACRERTLRPLPLPADESFTVEYVTDKPWSGYNWYKGNHRSVIQVNTDLPIFIERAIDLACHEGYPGPPRLQRAAGAAPGAGARLGRVLGVSAVQPAVPDRGGERELRGQRRVYPEERRASREKSSTRCAGIDPAQADQYTQVLGLVQG